MPKNGKTPSRTSGHIYPATANSRVKEIAEIIVKAAKGFRRDTFCFTVIGAIALISSSFGHGGTVALGFAAFYMLLVPTLRYFWLIDR
jgi:hypothetical protein